MKCFDYHKQNITNCENKICRYWIQKKENQNCCINTIDENKNMTLEEIGNIFNVTRMRICQIEKKAIQKIKDKLVGIL
jgi:DNA-directed RNA polymerase sigma subunit (sigma70/sigma32)